jgi:hypothetical protein
MANERHPPDATGFTAENEIDEVLGYANPNPERAGCPSRDVLVAASKREVPADHSVHRHLIKCSPCYRELRGLQQASGERRVIPPIRNWWLAAAAAAIVIVGTLAWLLLAGRDSIVPTGAPPPSDTPVSAQLDLRKYALMRGERQADTAPISLPRGQLNLTLLLPVGSEPGEYEIQIKDSSLTSRASTTGTAEIREFVTTLEVSLDTGALPPGTYELALRQPGADWRLIPVQVR